MVQLQFPLNLNVRKQGFILVAVPLCSSLILLAMLYALLSSAEQTALEETHINEVLIKATQMFDLVEQAETTIRTAKDLKFGSLKTNIAYGPAPHSYKNIVADLRSVLNTPEVLRQVSDMHGYLSRSTIKSYLSSGKNIPAKVRSTLSLLCDNWREFALDDDLDQDAFLRANGVTFSSTPISAYNLSRYLVLDPELLNRITDDNGDIDLKKIRSELKKNQRSESQTNRSAQQADVLVQLDNSFFALSGGEKLNLARLNRIGAKYTYAQQQSAASMAYLPKRTDELLADFQLNDSDSASGKNFERLTIIAHDAMNRLHRVYDLIHEQTVEHSILAEELRQMYSGIRRDVAEMRNLLNELNISHAQFIQKRSAILQRLKLCVAIGVAAMILVAFMSASLFSRKIASKLAVLTDNSKRVMRNEALNPPLNGTDEISELDHVFHVMMSSLREKTRRETSIIENAVDVICSIDDEGRFTAVSPSCQKSWGFSSDELIGRRYVALILPDQVTEFSSKLSSAQDDQLNFMIETTLVRKDGVRAETLWSGIWSKEDRSIFCVVHDISERKKIERLKQEFVQMISHDLRSPLTAILTFLELIGEGFFEQKPDRLSANAQTSVKDVERLLALINNLLDVEKMESGKLVSVIEEVSLKTIVLQSISSIRPIAERKEIEISCHSIDMIIWADANQIIQIIVNLLSNAIKFSPKNSVIRIDASRQEEFVEVSISDQGRGIPENLRSKIFDRFEQVELNDARVEGGSGLGLAICKAIVQAHGGTIGVEGTAEGGSRFWFRLPAERG